MTDEEELIAEEVAETSDEEAPPEESPSKAKTLRTWAIDLAIGAVLAVAIVSAFNRWG